MDGEGGDWIIEARVSRKKKRTMNTRVGDGFASQTSRNGGV